MSTNITTKAAFARICGVTKPGIAKAITAGKVQLLDKKVNLDHRITAEYYYGKTGKVLNPPQHAKKPKAARKKKTLDRKTTSASTESTTVPISPSQEPDQQPVDYDKPPDDGYKLPPGIKCFEDITIHNVNSIPADLMKKFKELEVAKKAKQDRDVKRGKLIDRDVVKKFISQLYIIDVNQIKTQEDRIVPELCGLFGFEDGGKESLKARKLIKNDSADLLESIQREVKDFLGGLQVSK